MQANRPYTTPAEMPPMTPELLLIGLIMCSMKPKARARLEEQIDQEYDWLKVIPIRGRRPPVSVLEAYRQAELVAKRMGVRIGQH